MLRIRHFTKKVWDHYIVSTFVNQWFPTFSWLKYWMKMRGSSSEQILLIYKVNLRTGTRLTETNSYIDDEEEYWLHQNLKQHQQRQKHNFERFCLKCRRGLTKKPYKWGIKTKKRKNRKKKEREQPIEIQWIMETSVWVTCWSYKLHWIFNWSFFCPSTVLLFLFPLCKMLN